MMNSYFVSKYRDLSTPAQFLIIDFFLIIIVPNIAKFKISAFLTACGDDRAKQKVNSSFDEF